MIRVSTFTASIACLLVCNTTLAADGNRLTYLDEVCDPYYPHAGFPKLTTPQWVGEEAVDAVVVLAIDDMRDPEKYEAYLRPILDRLKKIDGRAPVSIMTCEVDPEDPQFAKWIKEGLSIEVHTIDHPCPLLQGGDFDKAKRTYERCVDLMSEIPGNKPVAFRMPCCDSRNTPSPRFWMEIFTKRTAEGNFLQIDSSVFNVYTSADNVLPRDVVLKKDGSERFKRYVPFPSFVNTIENYPYPYVIGKLCWQFPCMVPSDWEAQNLHRPNNPETVDDMKAALDATVIKQGVFNMVFHPHGWIRNDQIVELIDYAQDTYGQRVKFLTFRESIDRLNQNLLANQPLRRADGADNGVRLLDLNNDRYLDVVIANDGLRQSRIWSPDKGRWMTAGFPQSLVQLAGTPFRNPASCFGVSPSDDHVVFVLTEGPLEQFWRFDGGGWTPEPALQSGLQKRSPFDTALHCVRMRDVDGDGRCELLRTSTAATQINRWDDSRKRWQVLAHGLPGGKDFEASTRFVDVNADGVDDVLFSNASRYSLYLLHSFDSGWSTKVLNVHRNASQPSAKPLPAIVRGDGTNNGVWFHSGHLWVQNEDTNRLPDFVDRLSFADMLKPLANRQATSMLPPVPIGAAKVDITPEYPVRLSGYGGRKWESEGVIQKLSAKALAIGADEGEGAAILITVENCGMTPAIRNKVAKTLAEKAHIRDERLAISVSHTHTAPCLTNWAPYLFGSDIPPDQQARIDRYTSELTDKLVQVALQALKARRPARLFWGKTTVDFAANRRVIEQGRWTGFGVQADGPVDHGVPVLVAKDEQGKLISVVANYACHCTTLGGEFNEIAGDWAGFAQDMIEQEYPGAVALITIGCGADANPQPRGTIEQAEQHGKAIADAVQQLIKDDFLDRIDARPRCRLTDIDLPLANLPDRQQWQQRAKESGATGYHARQMLKKLDAGQRLPTSVNYPLASWTFGEDLAMVFLGGEVVVDYAIRLKEVFDADRLWVTGYSNDVPCYIPSRRILREGGYEADHSMIYYARPTRFDPAVEDLIIDTVQKLVPAEFYSEKTQVDFPAPKSADDALNSFKLRPGMKIELVAVEPLIVDPVAFDWGSDGRLWVVEMRDYPNGMDWQRAGDPLGKPGGRIKVLTDRDGDGRYDTARVFLDGIPFATGVKVWREGILVTAAPDIFYAEDTDGDGQADRREVLYHGFGEGNQQHRVNGLRWGLDNWLHVGNGDSDGKIKSLRTGQVVDVSGRDLRIRPDQGLLETTSGSTQFGRACDDWGNWFGGNNSNPLWHYVLDDRYLSRNPHFAPPSVRKDVPQLPGAAHVFPVSRTLTRFNDIDRANRFTSACSPMIYRDELLGEAFRGNSFVCEPVHNLVHREVVTPDGVSFSSRRAGDEQQSEFLASADNWFRPTMVRTGPDGALWIADMVRFVIEHPKWIPQDWQRKLDLRAGDNRGRIYRLFPVSAEPREVPRLDTLDTAGLVAALESTNGWVRDTAQQMLIWRQDTSSVPALKKLATESKHATARLHALCTLDGLAQLDDESVLAALMDERAEVRRHGVRLSEQLFNQPRLSEMLPIVFKTLHEKIANDQDLAVRMQLAYSLGEFSDPLELRPLFAQTLAKLLVENDAEPNCVAAAMSSINRANVGGVLSAVLNDKMERRNERLVEQLLGMAKAMDADEAVTQALEEITRRPDNGFHSWQLSALTGLLDARERSRQKLDWVTMAKIVPLVEHARRLIADDRAADDQRLAAIRLLGRRDLANDEDVRRLASLVNPRSSASLQSAAVEAMGDVGHAQTTDKLLENWAAHSPDLRRQVLDTLLSRATWTSQLLQAIETKELRPGDIDASHRQRLLTHNSDVVRRRAEKLFAGATDVNRQLVVERYQGALKLAGSTARGKAVFSKRCSNCHKLENTGYDVGPDLAALTDRSPHALLVAMFDPNRAVEDKFLDYHLITDDGRQLTGILVEETGNSITLRAADGKQQTVLRGQIQQMRSSGKSLMPEGMEKDLSQQETADLIAYLRRIGPPPKQFPGNKPVMITADDHGILRLAASAARIYGPRIVFEQKYRNLGWWAREQDHAAWSLVIPQAGRYRVILDYASHHDAAGDRFRLSVAGESRTGVVESTGTWDDYREKEIDTLDLPAGAAELVFRSDGPVRSALLDLREVRLEPASE